MKRLCFLREEAYSSVSSSFIVSEIIVFKRLHRLNIERGPFPEPGTEAFSVWSEASVLGSVVRNAPQPILG